MRLLCGHHWDHFLGIMIDMGYGLWPPYLLSVEDSAEVFICLSLSEYNHIMSVTEEGWKWMERYQ